MCHMDAYLVGAPSFQSTFYKRRAAKPIRDAIMGDGVFATSFSLYRHLLAVGVRPPDPGIDRSGSYRGYAIHRRCIESVDAVRLELLSQPFMSLVRLGNDQKARSILVDAMDDAGASDAANSRQVAPTMVKQGVDQRSIKVTRRRVHDQSRGLIHHDEIGIFMYDNERDILCRGLGLDRRGHRDSENLPRQHFHGRIESATLCRHPTLDNQALQPFAGKRWQQIGKRLVEPLSMLRLANRRFDDGIPRTHWVSM